MSTWGVTGTSPLTDQPDFTEQMVQDFLKANWSEPISGIDPVNIDFGYEPDEEYNRKPFIVKCEENFTDQYGIDLGDRITQFDPIIDIHIWEHDPKRQSASKAGAKMFKLRSYVERFIKQNCNSLQPYLKHMYLLSARNIREPERTDWHHCVVTIRLVTWKVDAS